MIDVFDNGSNDQNYDFDPKKDVQLVNKKESTNAYEFPDPIPLREKKIRLSDNHLITGIDPIKDPDYFPPYLADDSIIEGVKKLYDDNPVLKSDVTFNPNDAWIQTYSGRRFTPTNPVVNAIVIPDIAHSLSMQCRFSGHTKKFYSVAQHCVLVSYICDMADALWGLMHDASEAYLVDVPRPLKHSGKFDAYLEFEDRVQKAICRRFNLSETEPASVRKADKILLATEARDLMSPLRSDWVQPEEPLPFKIDPLPPQEAKNLFMKRFFELSGYESSSYKHYLEYEDKG